MSVYWSVFEFLSRECKNKTREADFFEGGGHELHAATNTQTNTQTHHISRRGYAQSTQIR